MGALYSQSLVLLSVAQASPATADQNGTAYQVLAQNDPNFDSQDFEAIFQLTWTPTGVTNPTFDAFVEVSWDNANWIKAAVATQLTAAGTVKQVVSVKPGLYVRGGVDVGGTGGSHSWYGAIRLVSNASFNSQAA